MLLNRTKKLGAVYGRAAARDWRRSGALALLALSLAMPLSASAAPGDGAIVDAREALRKKDRKGLSVARAAAMASNHPLAQWADYFELSNRLPEAQQSELDAFYARWPATYVEDRLRNDWLLELGKRRDWVNFAVEYPRFRMNDDREVRCYALLLDHQAGRDVKDEALATWLAQRDADDGCALAASRLIADGGGPAKLAPADAWKRARIAMDMNRPRAAAQVV